MTDKVYQGTLKGDVDLCASCTYAIIREDDHGGKQIRCQHFKRFLTTKTLSCTGYYNKGLPSIYEMQDVAWAYIPRVGFKKYTKLTEDELKEFGEGGAGI